MDAYYYWTGVVFSSITGLALSGLIAWQGIEWWLKFNRYYGANSPRMMMFIRFLSVCGFLGTISGLNFLPIGNAFGRSNLAPN